MKFYNTNYVREKTYKCLKGEVQTAQAIRTDVMWLPTARHGENRLEIKLASVSSLSVTSLLLPDTDLVRSSVAVLTPSGLVSRWASRVCYVATEVKRRTAQVPQSYSMVVSIVESVQRRTRTGAFFLPSAFFVFSVPDEKPQRGLTRSDPVLCWHRTPLHGTSGSFVSWLACLCVIKQLAASTAWQGICQTPLAASK